MRGFLGWATLVAILGAIGYLVAPIVARPVLAQAVRAAVPFGGEGLEVDVSVSTLGLLQGTIDRIHVTGSDLSTGHVRIGNLDVAAHQVGLGGDHAFNAMTGTLDDVTVTRADDSQVTAQRVTLAGSSDRVAATATIEREEALAIVRGALDGAGLPIEEVELIDGGVRLSVLGQQTDVAIGTVDGAITIAASTTGTGSIVAFGPEPGDPWRITGVAASPNGLEVDATIDVGAGLTGR